MTDENAKRLLTALLSYDEESEWLEFKANNKSPEVMGERISALSNMAALMNRSFGYLVYGVDDDRNIVGTTLRINSQTVGNQAMKIWLENLIEPRLSTAFIDVTIDGKRVVIVRIPAAKGCPTCFKGIAYCRVGSATPTLASRRDIEESLLKLLHYQSEEERIVVQDCTEDDVFAKLDLPAYYAILRQIIPQKSEMIRKFVEEGFLHLEDHGDYSITLLGALCFARDFDAFPSLSRRAIRFVSYDGQDRMHGNDEIVFKKGYAIVFNDVIDSIVHHYRTERFAKALRVNVDPYSEIALREAVANMIIHGDLSAMGSGPLIEAFANRIEFSNPGSLRFDPDRILDVSPDARNHDLADFMHCIGIGDERGSGYDKMLLEAERLGSPSPLVETNSSGVRVVLFPPTPYEEESVMDIRRDIYFHCCLRYLSRTPMTNASVRARYGLGDDKTVEISKLIKSLVEQHRIKPIPNSSRKKMEYIPIWG